MDEYPKKADGSIDWDKYSQDIIESHTLTHCDELKSLLQKAKEIDWDVFSNHDSAIEEVFKEYKILDKNKFIDLFIWSLHTPYNTMGLYILGILKTFPYHTLSEQLNTQNSCIACASKATYSYNDIE